MAIGVTITRRGGVQILCFDRVEKKNAITADMYRALADGLAAGEADSAIGAHVITGAGGAFTAGNDIADFLALGASGGAALGEPVLRFLEALVMIEKPLIAAVDGLAVGIGATLLLHCDYVVATERAELRMPFIDLGLVPEAGASLLLPARIGQARAFAMLGLGQPVSAEVAHAWGLINAIVPADALADQAVAIAETAASKAPQAMAMTKRLLRGDKALLKARMTEEAKLFMARLSSGEAREAFSAFMEKRAPNFARA